MKSYNFIKILKFVLVIIIVFLVFEYFLSYFTPFILGYLISLILHPIFNFFVRKGVSRRLSSFISIILFITIISFLGTTIISKIIEQGKSFFINFPIYLEEAKTLIFSFNEFIFYNIGKLPSFFKNIFYTYYESIIYFLKDFFGEAFKSGSVQIIKKIPNFFMILVIAIISSFFFLSDKENIEKFISRQIPQNIKENLNIVKEGVLTVVFGYIKAQFIIMLIMGTICFVGLTFIKTPYSFFLSFIISFIDALPIFGSGMFFIPYAIYQLICKNYQFAVSLLIIYVIMVVTRQSIEHKIIGSQIGLHPLVTLISIYVGLKLFGFVGVIIMPIFVVIIKFLQQRDILPKWK